MTSTMEFSLLGPLAVRAGGKPVPIPAGKQRAVLAALLLSANQPVSLDELAATLWGVDPPPSARVSVQNYVMRLRKALAATGEPRITTHPGGYVVRVEPDELDLHQFEQRLRAAWAAAHDSSWPAAAAAAAAALSLWRGDPLADVGSEVLADREAPRLTELRLQTLEARIDADLHLGKHAEVIGELWQLTMAHPLRERFHGLLMLALYRDGRQADALAAYQSLRRTLVAELAAEPAAELRRLHQQMLTADPALAAPGAEPSPVAADTVVPRELPPTAGHFTGRAAELQQLSDLLAQSEAHSPGTVAISAIAGTGGVGKTALAVHWAHRVAHQFPDGQLYLNLRGYDAEPPVSPADALAAFLRSLGIPGPEVPADDDERAARYRSLLAGRRLLIMLDNASSVEQVRPLLPGSPGCMVVVTSRDTLAGLVARDGAIRLDLQTLTMPDALGLLRALIGQRVDNEPDAAEALAAQCGRLPLALRIAAEIAIARPGATLAELAIQLDDRPRRLDLLDRTGDARTAVRTIFSWSYRHLDPGSAHVFRLASLHPGPDFDAYCVAALAGSSLAETTRRLDLLARAYLVQHSAPDRYGMHDLLRAYGRELAAAHDGEERTRAALTRLLDHYLSTAASAMDGLHPAQRHLRPVVSAPATPAPFLADPDGAMAWLDIERPSLVAVATYAADNGWADHATRLSGTLFRYLQDGSHIFDGFSIYTAARRASLQTGDLTAEAGALTGLGLVYSSQGSYAQAIGHYRRALTLFRKTADRTGQARVLHNLANVNDDQGDYSQATRHYQQSLDLFRQVSEPMGQAFALTGLGNLADKFGQDQQAASYFGQALALFRAARYETGEAGVLTNLGRIDERTGQYQGAADNHQRALALFRRVGNRSGEATALQNLGLVDYRVGRCRQAADWQQQALTILREIGDLAGEAESRIYLGEALLADGRPTEAEREHTIALHLARQVGHRRWQARAHDGLGCCHSAVRNVGRAREHWLQAAAGYAEIGLPEAAEVRRRLARLDDGDGGADTAATLADATFA